MYCVALVGWVISLVRKRVLSLNRYMLPKQEMLHVCGASADDRVERRLKNGKSFLSFRQKPILYS
jgi:hypothetical protein